VLRLDAAIGATVTATSLTLPAGLPFEQWRRLLDRLERRETQVRWWIADALAYGQRTYRRDYPAALEQIYTRQSLHDLVYVARHVSPERRRESLSFSHHREVAALDGEEQRRWLEAAARGRWSTKQLRESLRSAGLSAAEQEVGVQQPPAEAAASRRSRAAPARLRMAGRLSPRRRFAFYATAELFELCRRAAERESVELADWAQRVLEEAAHRTLSPLEQAALEAVR
jgi:hypothetical protein